MHSAKAAIDRKTLQIDDDALFQSLGICLEEVGESTRDAYTKATRSAKPSNFIRQTLLACALAPQDDDFGSFTAAKLRKPLGQIMGRKRDITDYSRVLSSFLRSERGPILDREGTPKNYHYRFIDPMMQSYVFIRGLKDGLLRPPTTQK
jgi:hypothetical protein